MIFRDEIEIKEQDEKNKRAQNIKKDLKERKKN